MGIQPRRGDLVQLGAQAPSHERVPTKFSHSPPNPAPAAATPCKTGRCGGRRAKARGDTQVALELGAWRPSCTRSPLRGYISLSGSPLSRRARPPAAAPATCRRRVGSGRRARRGGGRRRGGRGSAWAGRRRRSPRVSQSRRNSVRSGRAAWADVPGEEGAAGRPRRGSRAGGPRVAADVAPALGLGQAPTSAARRRTPRRRCGSARRRRRPPRRRGRPGRPRAAGGRRPPGPGRPRPSGPIAASRARSRACDLRLELAPAGDEDRSPSGVRPTASRKTPSAAARRVGSTAAAPKSRLRRRPRGVAILDHAGQLDEVLVAGEEQRRLVAPGPVGGVPGDRTRGRRRRVAGRVRSGPRGRASGSTFVTVSIGDGQRTCRPGPSSGG